MTFPPVAMLILLKTSWSESVAATATDVPSIWKLPAVTAVAVGRVPMVSPLTSLVALRAAPTLLVPWSALALASRLTSTA